MKKMDMEMQRTWNIKVYRIIQAYINIQYSPKKYQMKTKLYQKK